MNAGPDGLSPVPYVREPVTVDGRECRHGCYLATEVPETTRHFADLARTWLRLAGDLEKRSTYN